MSLTLHAPGPHSGGVGAEFVRDRAAGRQHRAALADVDGGAVASTSDGAGFVVVLSVEQGRVPHAGRAGEPGVCEVGGQRGYAGFGAARSAARHPNAHG